MIMKHLGRTVSARCFLNIFLSCAFLSKSLIPTMLGPLTDSKGVSWTVMRERGNLILESKDICVLFFIPLMWWTASALCQIALFLLGSCADNWCVNSLMICGFRELYPFCPFCQQQKWHQIHHCLKTDTVLPRTRTEWVFLGFIHKASWSFPVISALINL